MKKIGMTVLVVLLLCVLTGCAAENSEETPESMTFADNSANSAKEFTIDSNFNFKVTFIFPDDIELIMQINPGDVISGKITGATGAWNSDLTGVATQMSSTSSFINAGVKDLPVEISLTYIKSGDAISAVTVAFPEESFIGQTAQQLMGKTYVKK